MTYMETSIIVIPGVDDKPVKEWSKAYNVPLVCYLVERSTPALRIQVSVLEHQLTSTTFKHWGQLDRQAQLLLDKLEGFVQTWNVSLLGLDRFLPAN